MLKVEIAETVFVVATELAVGVGGCLRVSVLI